MIAGRTLAGVFAFVLVVSAVAGAAPGALASPDSPPEGMVGVPGSNVADARASSVAGDALEASSLEVYASAHADTLNVSIVTTEQADAVASGTPLSEIANLRVCSSPAGDQNSALGCDTTPGLVLTDDVHSEGREVALRAEPVREALGHEPSFLTVRNAETGERWEYPVEKRDGWLVVDVEHFSSNSVTFSGNVSLAASPASDGTQISYSINDLDAASDPVVGLTGRETSEWDNESASSVSASGSSSVAIAGNIAPTGPGPNGEPELSVTLPKATYNPVDDVGDGVRDGQHRIAGDNGNDYKIKSEIEVSPSQSRTVEKLNVNISKTSGDYNPSIDIYIASEGVDETYGEGTLVRSDWNPSFTTGVKTISLDTTYDVSGGQTYTVEFVTTNSDNDGNYDSLQLGLDDSPSSSFFSYDNGAPLSRDYHGDLTLLMNASVSNLDVSTNTGETATIGSLSGGQTSSVELDVGTSTDTLNFSGSGDPIDYNFKFEERTTTVDPSVEVNGGNWINYTGTLSSGSETTLTGNSSWLTSGSNTVTVYLGDVSTDAPAPEVKFNYSHDAKDYVSTTYTDKQWTSRYNVSKTYADSYEEAAFTLPYKDTVVNHRQLEYRINSSGGWTSVASSDYTLSGSELEVDVDALTGGTVKPNTQVEIRANASKVYTHNLTITVVNASAPGEELNTKVRADTISNGAYIGIGPTAKGDRVHYATSSVYSDEDYVVIESNGDQELYLPNAGAGDTLRVQATDTEVNVNSGDVKIQVVQSGESPELDVSPGPGGSGDSVTVRYYRTTSGLEYVLNSVTRGVVLDSAVAQSPVTLQDDDSSETWEILEEGSGTSSSSGGGGGGGVAGQFAREANSLLGGLLDGGLVPIAVLGAGVVGVVVLGRRVFGGGDSESSSPTRSGDSGSGLGASLVGGVTSAVSGLLAGAASVAGRAASAGVDAGLEALERPRVLTILGALGAVGLVVFDVIEIPGEVGILLLVSGIPLVTFLVLRELDQFSMPVFATVAAISTLVGLQLLGGDVVDRLLEALGPVIPLVALGGLYLAYKAVQAARTPEEENTVTLNVDDGGES